MATQGSFYNRPEFSDVPPSSVPPASSVLKETLPTATSPRRVKIVFGVWGTLLMIFFMIIPAWSALELMQDTIFAYFVGRHYALMLLVACAGGVLLYAVTVNIFLRMARPDMKTEQSMFMIFVLVLSATGLAFMLVSIPMLRQSEIAYDQLFNHCATGSLTRPIFEYAEILQAIRARPNCTERVSVEDCSLFFVEAPYTALLQEMEHEFRCAGFGYRNVTVDLSHLIAEEKYNADNNIKSVITSAIDAVKDAKKDSGIANSSDAVKAMPDGTASDQGADGLSLQSSLVLAKPADAKRPVVHSKLASRSLALLAEAKRETQTRAQPEAQQEALEGNSKRRRQKAGPVAAGPDLFLLSVNNTLLEKHVMRRVKKSGQKAQVVSESRSASSTATRQSEYPPGLYPQPLFTNAVYQASCDGQAARHMRYLGMGTARNIYNMGIVLLVMSVVLGFAEFFSFCAPRKRL